MQMSETKFNSDKEALDSLNVRYKKLTDEIAKVIVGQDEVIKEVLISIFSGGHSLLVGVPGLAKTLLVNTISRSLGLTFNRIQFTPDLMPSDIIGSEILGEDRKFKFVKGPLFSNIVLADEISPDGCRLWDLKTGEKMDKDRFRQDLGGVMEGYEEVLARLTKARA
jgi:MoxR-like ATPase